MQNSLNTLLDINFPLIMAPMFLVTNEAMIIEAMKSGIAGTFPSLNYRKEGELELLLGRLNALIVTSKSKGTYGVNLIVGNSNILYEKHLDICVAHKVPFYITSLGNPGETIKKAHEYGAKVFCDVTGLEHAEIAYRNNCDGFIAVGHGAGGHAGKNAIHVLIPALKKKFPEVPVIAAGSVTSGKVIASMMMLGAAGVSVGTLFIASKEAGVSNEYKKAVISSGMNDIVLTERLSGVPANIINTAYAKKLGYRQNFIEKIIMRNKSVKKYYSMLIHIKGLHKLENSIKPGNYRNLWVAGQGTEDIDSIETCSAIIEKLKAETTLAIQEFQQNNIF